MTELDNLYYNVKADVLALLTEMDTIALMLNIWSDNKMRGCLGVTVHIIIG